MLAGTWNIPTFFVPLLLVTHFMIFVRLLKGSHDYNGVGDGCGFKHQTSGLI
jgi:hypothetical protein